MQEGKNIQPLLPTKVWEYIDHNNFTRNNHSVQFHFSFYLLKSAGKIVILPDNEKLPYVAFACYPKLFSVFYLE
jgi:hypothetical protein